MEPDTTCATGVTLNAMSATELESLTMGSKSIPKHNIPESRCPYCWKLVDSSLDITVSGPKRDPKPGDITLCSGCGHLSMFGDFMKLVKLSKETIEDIRNGPDWKVITDAQKAIAKLNSRN